LVGKCNTYGTVSFSIFLHRYRCRSRLYTLSNSLCTLSFIYFSHLQKNLKIPVSFLLFINNRLFISQEKSLKKTNSYLFYSYNIISFLLKQFGLVIKHGKSKVFHFSRSHRLFNPPLLDLSLYGSPILKTPGDTSGLSLTKNFHFNNTSSSTPTKCCWQSNAWKY